MSTPLPRLRRALESENAGHFGIEGPPRDFLFHNCIVVDDPKLKVHLTYYDRDPEKFPEEAPLYTREILVSTKEGVTFSTFWHQNKQMLENVAEKGKDEAHTWTLGMAGMKGVDYIRVKIMEA